MRKGVTVGVEEEFHVVDRATGTLRTDAERIVAAAEGHVEGELQRSVVEAVSPPCRDLDDLWHELRRSRRRLCGTAAEAGRAVVAAGTLPTAVPGDERTARDDRYERIEELYGQVTRDQLVCGLHVHVAVPDRDAAVAVMNHARPWLPVLRALSCSSPYWARRDTGYASYRTLVWRRWPLSTIPGTFRDAAEYDALLHWLIATGTLLDAGMAYFDVRPSAHQPTVEFRVADTCTRVDEAVLQAGLCRALALTCLEAAERGAAPPAVRDEQLLAATWHAARHGTTATLIDPVTLRAGPAAAVVRALLVHVGPALAHTGDGDRVGALADRCLRAGTSAARQRDVAATGGTLAGVVDHLVDEMVA